MDLIQIKRMKINDYEIMMKAHTLQRMDDLELEAFNAKFQREMQACDEKTGKYIIQQVSDLVNVKEVESSIFEKEDREKAVFQRLHQIAKNLETWEGGNDDRKL